MLKLVKWAIHRLFFLSCPLWQGSKTPNKSFLSSKELRFRGYQNCINGVDPGSTVSIMFILAEK
jgi:hypothetical protein